MDIYQKYSSEYRKYAFNFTQLPEVVAGDTITAVSVTASPSTGITIGATSINGANAEVIISGGTVGTLYTITCQITTSTTAVVVSQGQLLIVG